MNKITVWKNESQTGALVQPARRRFEFMYKTGSQAPISYNMPTHQSQYTFNELPPVFQTFMPEGALREELVKQMGQRVSGDVTDMDILAAIGSNSLGVLNFSKHGEDLHLKKALFSQDSINQAEDELAAFNKAMGEHYLSGVAGVQPKFLARAMSKDDLIVKSYNPFEYPALTVVEQVCMEIADNIGIDVAKTSLSKQGHVLFVSRFDIKDNKYIEMEELCSIMGHGTAKKYDGSYEQIAKHTASIHRDSLSALFKQIVFHNIIRNGDAHSKNFAILDGKLSPMYDALCTKIWVPNDQMALQLNGSKRWASDNQLIRFASERCGIAPSRASAIIKEMRADILSNMGIIERYMTAYKDIRHIEPVLENLREYLLLGCAQKSERELKLHSIGELTRKDKLRQTFKDDVEVEDSLIGDMGG